MSDPLTALTPARLIALAGVKARPDDSRLVGLCEATTAYVNRYREGREWTADTELGAAYLARGLWRDGHTPSIGEGWEQQGNVFARLTDIKIEQLLRIGRFAPPAVG